MDLPSPGSEVLERVTATVLLIVGVVVLPTPDHTQITVTVVRRRRVMPEA